MPASKAAGLTHYLRARAYLESGGLWVEPLRSQASGDLSSVTGFEALAVLPRDATHLRRGARVETLLLRPPRQG